MSDLLLATRSEHKASEIRRIVPEHLRSRLISLTDAGLEPTPEEDHIENYDTFRENALAKAIYFRDRAAMATIADDSGIVVPALGGAPGVRSKRYCGRTDVTGVALDRANNQALLAAMEPLTGGDRRAYYVCTAAFATTTGVIITSLATVSGIILREPVGDAGFGYDPLFFVPSLDCTFAQVDVETKNRLSHRGRAFRTLASAIG